MEKFQFLAEYTLFLRIARSQKCANTRLCNTLRAATVWLSPPVTCWASRELRQCSGSAAASPLGSFPRKIDPASAVNLQRLQLATNSSRQPATRVGCNSRAEPDGERERGETNLGESRPQWAGRPPLRRSRVAAREALSRLPELPATDLGSHNKTLLRKTKAPTRRRPPSGFRFALSRARSAFRRGRLENSRPAR